MKIYCEKVAPQKVLPCMCACIWAYTFLYIITSLNNHLHVSVMQKKKNCVRFTVTLSSCNSLKRNKKQAQKSTLIWQGVKQNECFAHLYFRCKLHNPVNFMTLFQLLIK